MNKTINFNNYKELNNYIKNRTNNKRIGEGTEAICYLGKDGLCYKVFKPEINEIINSIDRKKDIERIITTSDIKTSSFIFPIKLFTINDELVGYYTKYVNNDLLLNNHINNNFIDLVNYKTSIRDYIIENYILNSLKNINFDKMKKSYHKIYKDVIQLSKNNIYICDLYHNLLFDGKSFVAIDTDYYERVNFNPEEHNINELDYAIKEELESLIEIISDYKLDNNEDVFTYIDEVENIFKNNFSNYYSTNNTKHNILIETPKKLVKRR